MKRALLTCVFAGWAGAQVMPYELKVETGPGLIALTFSTQQNQARAYLPDDLAPGESFSGAMEGQPNYVMEFAGQRARVRDGSFHWKVPAVSAGDFVPLILRDLRGRELARASVPIVAQRPAEAAFRFPKFVQAGSPATVLGPFDGDSASTQIVIGGHNAPILAESPRKAIFRAPEQLLGPLPYSLKKGDVEKTGELHSVAIETTRPAGATLSVLVRGLNQLPPQEEVPLKLDTDYIFIRAADVRPDGSYAARLTVFGLDADPASYAANLIFPQTPRDEVGLVLHAPRKDRAKDVGQEHAEALHDMGFDTFPLLQDFLTDYDLGSEAAYAMLAADEPRALSVLFATMPASGPNIERIGLAWFVSHPGGTASNAAAHAAALRVLAAPGSSSDAVELALHTLGLAGSAADFPVLERHYQYRSAWNGLRRIHDASEAAMARLGSKPHLENIRKELTAPVPERPTPEQAVHIGQILEKAGFSGQSELLPAVCPHLADPAVVDIDVTWDPKLSAMVALNAIVNKTTPLASSPRRSLDQWKAYCGTVSAP
jgi:hypothetical protein